MRHFFSFHFGVSFRSFVFFFRRLRVVVLWVGDERWLLFTRILSPAATTHATASEDATHDATKHQNKNKTETNFRLQKTNLQNNPIFKKYSGNSAICALVKETVEPIMESLRPPGIIKRIFFQEFTFGTAPFRVEGIAVKEDPTGIDMELDVRWSGDANITLGELFFFL